MFIEAKPKKEIQPSFRSETSHKSSSCFAGTEPRVIASGCQTYLSRCRSPLIGELPLASPCYRSGFCNDSAPARFKRSYFADQLATPGLGRKKQLAL